MNYKKCFFTGHRGKHYLWQYNENDSRCKKLKRMLKIQIEKAILQGYNYFLHGMALQADMWFAEAVLDLKGKYPFIQIESVIPCRNQEKKWLLDDKIRYRNSLAKMDFVTFCSHEEFNPNLNQMINRNYYMVDQNCTLGMSICNGQPSGTKKTLDYANSKNIDTVVINPNTFEITINKKEPKILECSSKGDKRYSAFYAKVKVFNKEASIEEHYQLSKVLDGNIYPKNIKQVKGKCPKCFRLLDNHYELKYMSAWYKLLWCKYLDQHNNLVQNAMLYDDYNDMFKGKNTRNCQADVIRQYIQEGRKSILQEKEIVEFIKLIKSTII